LLDILRIFKPSEACSCEDCRFMCRVPCWPFPHEAVRLIRRGYGQRLRTMQWHLNEEKSARILRPLFTGGDLDDARCVLQDPETGLCELHDLGMKPFEGRIAHHAIDRGDTDIRNMLAELWDTECGRATINYFMSAMWKGNHENI